MVRFGKRFLRIPGGHQSTVEEKPIKRKAEEELKEEIQQKRLKSNDTTETSQDIIRERTAEVKARRLERIEHDKEIIVERTKENEICLQEVFPENVWLHILSWINHAADLESMFKADSMFRNLLEGTRTQNILLPLMYPLIHESMTSSDRQARSYLTSTFRLTSHSMRNAVDRWYEDNLMSCLRGGRGHVPSYSAAFNCSEHMMDRTLEKFCSGPKKLRAKRFFQRSIEFNVGTAWTFAKEERSVEERFREFKIKLVSLLEVIGDQIWHFIFDWYPVGAHFRDNKISLGDIFDFLKQLTTLMPNLKWIEIYFIEDHWKYDTSGLTGFIIRNSHFPTLRGMERIDFEFSRSGMEDKCAIMESVLYANPQIKTVNISQPDEESQMKTLRKMLNHLYDSLHSTGVKLNGFHLHNGTELDMVLPLKSVASGLKSLDLWFDIPFKKSLAPLFKFINKFPSLENLSLRLDLFKFGGDADSPALNLPNLKHFEFTFRNDHIDYLRSPEIDFFYSLQFLISSKRLRTLIWNNKTQIKWVDDYRAFLVDHEDHENITDFKGGFRNIRNSNIWKVFPELDRVMISMWVAGVAKKRGGTSWPTYATKEYRH